MGSQLHPTVCQKTPTGKSETHSLVFRKENCICAHMHRNTVTNVLRTVQIRDDFGGRQLLAAARSNAIHRAVKRCHHLAMIAVHAGFLTELSASIQWASPTKSTTVSTGLKL